MADDATPPAPPLIPAIHTDAEGVHYLAGSRCEACGKLFVGARTSWDPTAVNPLMLALAPAPEA